MGLSPAVELMWKKAGEVLFYKRIEEEVLERTLKILKPYHYPIVLEGREYLYVDEDTFADDPFLKVLQATVADRLRPITGNEDQLEASKLSIDIRGRECKGVLDRLSKDYDIIYHGTDFVELVPGNFSKATGIEKTCECLQIAHEDTYAFWGQYERLRYDSLCAARDCHGQWLRRGEGSRGLCHERSP